MIATIICWHKNKNTVTVNSFSLTNIFEKHIMLSYFQISLFGQNFNLFLPF